MDDGEARADASLKELARIAGGRWRSRSGCGRSRTQSHVDQALSGSKARFASAFRVGQPSNHQPKPAAPAETPEH